MDTFFEYVGMVVVGSVAVVLIGVAVLLYWKDKVYPPKQ
jgi:hypothetical protein